MSVVIIGGNERMEAQYKELCKQYNGKAKIFTKTKGPLKKKIGNPDLMIMFTNTVSHKMILSASGEAKSKNIEVIKTHSSSLAALKNVLETFTGGQN